jgi:catechol 2,3-dioxygenase-like lactoylglutathione lyase family enzyme
MFTTLKAVGAERQGNVVESLIPVLDVRDVGGSVAYYCDLLGFELCDMIEWGGKIEWALLRTGDTKLMLCASDGDGLEERIPRPDGVFFVYIKDIASLLLRLHAHEEYAAPEPVPGSTIFKEFYLRDPDGYLLWISHKPASGNSAF